MTGRWRAEQLYQGLFSVWNRGTNTAEGILLGLSGVQFILIQTQKGSLPEQCHVALKVSPILLIQKATWTIFLMNRFGQTSFNAASNLHAPAPLPSLYFVAQC